MITFFVGIIKKVVFNLIEIRKRVQVNCIVILIEK